MPPWRGLDWKVRPLQSFEARKAIEQATVQLGEDRLVVVAEIRRHCRCCAAIRMSLPIQIAALHCRNMRHNRSEASTPPMTLGQALAVQVRLIVWCMSRWHQAESDIADQVERHGERAAVIDLAARLRCALR
jgi:hypothetical protein